MSEKRPPVKMVPLPTDSIIPERDLGRPPVLETRQLGIDFGGLTAVDDFNLAIGPTEIAGLIREYPDRFMIGSDIVGYWGRYTKEITKFYVLLDLLDDETAQMVASENILRLLGTTDD